MTRFCSPQGWSLRTWTRFKPDAEVLRPEVPLSNQTPCSMPARRMRALPLRWCAPCTPAASAPAPDRKPFPVGILHQRTPTDSVDEAKVPMSLAADPPQAHNLKIGFPNFKTRQKSHSGRLSLYHMRNTTRTSSSSDCHINRSASFLPRQWVADDGFCKSLRVSLRNSRA